MMKIVIITPDYPPYTFGGIGSYNYELVRELIKRNFRVTVIAPSLLSDDMRIFGSYHKVYYLKTPSLRPLYFYFQLHNTERIRKIIEHEKPDILQLNVASNILVKSLRDLLKGTRLVLVFHGSPSPFNRQWDSLKHFDVMDIMWITSLSTYSMLERVIGDEVLDYVDVAVHVGKHVMYYNLLCFEKLRHVRNTVIYPGINVTEYVKYAALKETLRESNSVVKSFKNFIFGARLMRYKGVAQLLEAFSLANKKDKRMALHIYGDGPLKHYVLRFIASTSSSSMIFYYGKVSRELFLNNIATSDVLVHPSFYEAFSLTILEAALLNKPVIAHKAPWSEEEVESFNIGVTVDVLNREKFAEVLLSIVDEDNYERAVKKLKNQRTKLYNTFSSEIMAENYIRLYYKLM